MSALLEKSKRLPEEPGIYLMKDAAGVIIYVGKAKNLKNRVSSYFYELKDRSLRIKNLVADICDFDIILAHSEVEALLLERTMIKSHGPRYNVLLRDDKEYPIVRIDYNETWPRIEKVRRAKDDGATYIGPFGHASVLNTTLKTVGRIFPLVRCSEYEFKAARRPCNYYHMKMCLAPCTKKEVDQKAYLEMVRHAESLLRGQNKTLREELTKKMLESSQREDYENAALLRDQIRALETINDHQVAMTLDLEEADVIGCYMAHGSVVFHVLMVRNCQISGKDHYILEEGVHDRYELLTQFMMQFYELRHLPQRVLLPFSIPSIGHVMEALKSSASSSSKVSCEVPRKKEEKQLLLLAQKNAGQIYREMGFQEERLRVELSVLKEQLGLSRIPKVMECMDISNLQDSQIVASQVTFVDGKPAKKLYRKYKIKTVTEGPDDFASMREVMARRLRRAAEEGDLPDLIVIDGGKGQLSSALSVLSEYKGMKVSIVSLAKNKQKESGPTHERVFLPEAKSPILLKPGSPSYRILTAIRDEAHRFAITYHRKRRDKAFKKSVLDDIPGVGEVLRKRLLTEFSSVEAIKKASIEALTNIKGVHKELARTILNHLNKKD